MRRRRCEAVIFIVAPSPREKLRRRDVVSQPTSRINVGRLLLMYSLFLKEINDISINNKTISRENIGVAVV